MKRLLILCAAAALALGACGGSSTSSSTSSGTTAAPASTSGGGGGTQLSLTTDPGGQLKFNTNTLNAKAGKVTITMTNTQGLSHDIALKGGVSKIGATVGQGGTSTITVDLKPGQYTFYCSVDSHEAAGMNGDLIVK